MFFFQGTIGINGFSMVLTALKHHHLMFFDQPTIDFNGFSMVFRLFRTMVNDGLETPKLQNAIFKVSISIISEPAKTTAAGGCCCNAVTAVHPGVELRI